MQAKEAVTSEFADEDSKCTDYQAIYTDNRGENIHQRKFCGEEITQDFQKQLPCGSFSMVLWTDKVDNTEGKFEFEVTRDAAIYSNRFCTLGTGSGDFIPI